MITYRIYNPVRDEYSDGGRYWSKTGKTWSSTKNLSAYFNNAKACPRIVEEYTRDKCVVISYNEVSREPVENFMK